ncbi:GTPase IMAP family member 7 [Liparis tanakae]|uniref:GTPase IMAP family member 7 n=1 Tax=Liparis tanakae TaxID=230148 RepID=A0A4Z2GYP6_9TELE|nr:GTPase IMAP family member 7 [Liparis tanakae]
MSTPAAETAELRLAVLGRAADGRRSAVSSILGLAEPPPGRAEECSKHRGEAAGRRVVVVSSPVWLGSGCDPEERRRHVSSFLALSSPGPNAFLLRVPVNQPADGEANELDVLEKLFGPSAVAAHAIVLFTHTEELEEDEQLAGYLAMWRKDLLELVERCGGRYHTLETRGEEEEGKAVEELMEKVEQAQPCSCPLYQEAEERVRERQVEMVRRRRGGDHMDPQPEGDVTEEEMAAVRDEAERSVGDLDVDVESIFPPPSPPLPAPSLLWGLWEKLTGWTRWLPRFLRREALLGALVGLFVGGPFGGMMGATVGSVATEVARRKTQKTK